MSIVTSQEMFAKAYAGGYAIGAFNVNNMEIIQGITEAAKECNAPVILQVSSGARKYANRTYLVKLVEELGVNAIGISGKDGGLLKVEKKYSNGEDIGFVGEITEVNPKILYDLLEKDFLPIVCPVGMDDAYNSYNINADDAACAIAKAVSAEKLAFLTDIEGVYKDPSDKSTLISELTIDEARALIGDGFIGGGMLPKLNNCIDAIENGVSRVHILDGRIAHCLLLEIFTNRGIGTAILSEKEKRYYNE
jgi:acetylglutamate kinase